MQGLNDWKKTGYGVPCPPIGPHRYFFELHALDIVLPNLGRPSKADLLKAMEGHVVAGAELVGTYEKRLKRAKRRPSPGEPPSSGVEAGGEGMAGYIGVPMLGRSQTWACQE
jgi:Phosphatidylethanolamine-binding protein